MDFMVLCVVYIIFENYLLFGVGNKHIKKKDFIYSFLDRGEGREKERERSINMWLFLVRPHWGPHLQPRRVPLTGN